MYEPLGHRGREVGSECHEMHRQPADGGGIVSITVVIVLLMGHHGGVGVN